MLGALVGTQGLGLCYALLGAKLGCWVLQLRWVHSSSRMAEVSPGTFHRPFRSANPVFLLIGSEFGLEWQKIDALPSLSGLSGSFMVRPVGWTRR